jgi:hypothetical protein
MLINPPLMVPVRSSLLTLYTCAALSGETVPKLLALVDDGAIRLAFNVGTQDTVARCVRIATKSIADYMEHGRKLRTETPAQVTKEIVELLPPIHPAERQEIAAPALQTLFCCSQHHIERLTSTGCLRVTRPGRRGKGGATIFDRRSVVKFLEERRIS